MEKEELEHKLAETEKNVESLVSMVSELYEKVHRVERVLIDEGTIEVPDPEIDEHGPDGLFADARTFVQEAGRCSVSLLQKQFKITYKMVITNRNCGRHKINSMGVSIVLFF